MTIDRRHRSHQQRARRLRPDFDRLSSRVVLSTATVGIGSAIVGSIGAGRSSVVATDPGSSSVLPGSPATIAITFDRAISAFSLTVQDFRIVPVSADGVASATAVGSLGMPQVDPSDPAQARVLLPVDSSLNPGSYEVVLDGANQIQGQDGTPIAGVGRDQVVDRFQVGHGNAGLGGATDLGTIGATVSVAPGSIDLANNPAAVQIYKIEIAPGSFQRLGLAVVTPSSGARLNTTLSLFDARENLISTSTSTSQGGDPYLFAGLNPGTYYVGVSDAGNVPGQVGGYQQDSTSSISVASQPGSSFALQMVADPVTGPTQVRGIQVDHADPLSSSPTGITLDFSGTIDVLKLSKATTTAIMLVDSLGQAWPATVVGYDAARAQVSVVFNRALPEGSYSVEIGTPGSLADLAGMTPVAPGQAPGVLGTFEVKAAQPASGDLGVAYPRFDEAALTSSTTVAPGTTVRGTFTVLQTGVYMIGQAGDPVTLTLMTTASGGTPASLVQARPTINGIEAMLQAGVYTLSIANNLGTAAHANLQVVDIPTPYTLQLDSGVGQGPALSVRLISPSIDASGATTTASIPATVPGPRAGVSGSYPATTSGSTGAAAGVVTSGGALNPVAPASSAIGFTVVGVPVGRPSAKVDQISVVGPATSSPLGAMALNSDALPAGLTAVPVPITPGAAPEPEAPTLLDLGPVAINRPSASGSSPVQDGPEAAVPATNLEDHAASVEAAWVDRAFQWTMKRLGGMISNDPEPRDPGAVVDATGTIEAGSDFSTVEPEMTRIEVASLASPLGLGVAAIVAIRYKRRKAGLAASNRVVGRTTKDHLRGPHRRRSLVP